MIATMYLLAVALAAEKTAQSPTAATATTTAAERDKLICRRYDVTGSLVTKKKVCHTKREWAQVETTAREEVDKMTAHISTEKGN